MEANRNNVVRLIFCMLAPLRFSTKKPRMRGGFLSGWGEN